MTSLNGYEGIVLCAPVTIPYVRRSERSTQWFAGRAIAELLSIAGIRKNALEGLSINSFTLAPDSGVSLAEHIGLAPRWLDQAPGGGASAIMGLRKAARAVASGDAEVVACVASDVQDKASFRDVVASFSRFAQDAVYPIAAPGPSFFGACVTSEYMRLTGATAEDFGRLCVAQRQNALTNPYALLRTPLTVADYLASRMICDPIRLLDCVMPCCGAEAFLVTTEQNARRQGLPFARLLSTMERHNAFADDAIQLRGGWLLERDTFYSRAGRGPEEVDLLCTYDDYPVISLLQVEGLGFCGIGQGADFVRDRDLTVGGDFPVNTSGGQLSAGQAGSAGGAMGLVECLRQLTAQVLGSAVTHCRTAIASGFGMITYDRGMSCAAAMLAAA